MNLTSRSCRVAAVGLLALVALTACLVPGYGGDVDVGYVGGVYEPGGYEYGGWGPGYRVGPPRGGAYHGQGRAAPSIPHGARGGGARGGGARGGGARGGGGHGR